MLASPFDALISVLRCPTCRAQDWRRPDAFTVACAACGGIQQRRNGVLHISLSEEHPEVVQERAAVPGTENVPELGGWRESGYAPDTDPDSPLGRAYLSLPYGDGSSFFDRPGYFQSVRRFAEEFDFILRRLPRSGLLLDVGADGTWSTAQLSRRGLTCIALDITDHLVLSRLFQTSSPPYAL